MLRPPLPPTNLYFLSISRVHEVKSGPFHEHSSQLYAIATAVPNWGKVNSGLFKMYEVSNLHGLCIVMNEIGLSIISRNRPKSWVREWLCNIFLLAVSWNGTKLIECHRLMHLPRLRKRSAALVPKPLGLPRFPIPVSWVSGLFPRPRLEPQSQVGRICRLLVVR